MFFRNRAKALSLVRATVDLHSWRTQRLNDSVALKSRVVITFQRYQLVGRQANARQRASRRCGRNRSQIAELNSRITMDTLAAYGSEDSSSDSSNAEEGIDRSMALQSTSSVSTAVPPTQRPRTDETDAALNQSGLPAPPLSQSSLVQCPRDYLSNTTSVSIELQPNLPTNYAQHLHDNGKFSNPHQLEAVVQELGIDCQLQSNALMEALDDWEWNLAQLDLEARMKQQQHQ